jgi:hypothetical protein
MEVITILIYSMLLLLTVFWLSAFIVMFKNYQYYKPTAEALLNGTYVYYEPLSKHSDVTYYRDPENVSIFSDDQILFFPNGSIKLLGDCAYIHKSIVTYSDPYSIYWRWKIIKIFKETEAKRTQQLKTSTIK